MESLTLGDWRPAEFLVVAQLDVTLEALGDLSLTVEFDDVHGEHTAVLRLPSGPVFCLVATPPWVPGFALLCGDPGSMGWEDALDVFLAQTPFERSAVTWVPPDASEPGERPSVPGYSWKDGTGLLGVDDPGLVDAAFERGEPHAGVAVIGLAGRARWPWPMWHVCIGPSMSVTSPCCVPGLAATRPTTICGASFPTAVCRGGSGATTFQQWPRTGSGNAGGTDSSGHHARSSGSGNPPRCALSGSWHWL